MADVGTEETEEILLFLPGWSTISKNDLSDLISSTGHENLKVTIAIVSITDDDVPPSYHHNRILDTIVRKEVVMDLLILYQVTQIPFSIVIPHLHKPYSRSSSSSSSSTEHSAIGTSMKESYSKEDSETEDSEIITAREVSTVSNIESNKNNNNKSTKSNKLNSTGKVHTIQFTPEKDHDASYYFHLGVESYDNFNFLSAASNFYSAISLDPVYKSALFNFAGLLHMVGYPILSIYYIQQVLLLDQSDMIAHSFLWALTQLEEIALVGTYVHMHFHY